MINFKTKVNGNVILVEPNSINVNNDIVNSVPKYEDMHIFAELTAESKGRTVISDGITTTTNTEKLNFIGNDQKKGDNNYLNFTTNYYDGSTDDGIHYEGFGIEHIKIKVNSSFIPQINIRFVDIRGLAFFNQKDSPYRMLFDFPPPIFTLTIKGYYGKATKYKIHLLKYTTEFIASNGNFIIDAQFVAVTFAPLADILFRYVVNFPLIDSTESYTPIAGEKPKNTYELILKLKNLYVSISDKLKTNNENNQYNIILNEIESIKNIIEMLKYIHDNEGLNVPGKPFFFIKTTETYVIGVGAPTNRYKLQKLNSLSEYDRIIKGQEISGINNNLNARLYIAYVAGTNLPYGTDEYIPIDPSEYIEPVENPYKYPTQNLVGFKKSLNDFKRSLESNVLPVFNLKNGSLGEPKDFVEAINIEDNSLSKTRYFGMDITNFYYSLYNKNTELNNDRNDLSLLLAKKINEMVSQSLGMIPTISNVFNVILNDVDKFFEKLKVTSIDAEDKHNEPDAIEIISNNNINTSTANIPDYIYSFPLITNTVNIYGGKKIERIAPIELNNKTEFPELNLIEDFMNTFVKQKEIAKQYNAKRNQFDDGTYKWVPLSPLDSKLGGGSPVSPYLNLNNKVTDDLLMVLLKRFYMLTQGSLGEKFYEENIVGNAYVDMFSKAEAINIVTALVSEKNASNIKIMSDKYHNNIDEFYDRINEIETTYNDGSDTPIKGNLYDFPRDDPKFFQITPSNISDGKVYVDKYNSDFIGVRLYTGDIVLQNISDSSKSTRPIDNFGFDAKKSFWKKLWGGDNVEHVFYNFTQENVIFLRDINGKYDNGEKLITDNISLISRGLIPIQLEFNTLNEIVRKRNFPNGGDINKGQVTAYNEGNISFKSPNNFDETLLKKGGNIIDVWSKMLSNSDVLSALTQEAGIIQNMLILSNFGTTASPFNIYPNGLNKLIFNVPAVVEIPAFYAAYLGMLISINENQDDLEDIFDFFNADNGIGMSLPYQGFFIFADLHDVRDYLSENDKEMFKTAYREFSGKITDIISGVNSMSEIVDDNVGTDKIFESKEIGYEYLLNPDGEKITGNISRGGYFNLNIVTLMERKTIVNFSNVTFDMSGSYQKGYESIKGLNNVAKYDKGNKRFFQNFFNVLSQEIKKTITDLKDTKIELRKVKGDPDIINQLYYSFKNINDKWITGMPRSTYGYPQNKKNKKLINSFAFVDRGMNPIGDTVINTEILVDMLDDPNISLFSVLTQLLSLNGFEFFPLQNFMNIDGVSGWEDSFKIHSGNIFDETTTQFICMYIGGSSSYPSVGGNGFENDGIIDLSDPRGLPDYMTLPDKKTTNIDEENNTDFPWRQVRAFRVRFGEQNQSMFNDFKIDSKEYPETNESIQILSRLAGDNNPDAPVPKGQNLYNLYENRSYKATITGFGNAMIQPTQYFQLENVPLFNGAYIILNIEHNITANKMVTSFSGTKLLKYPVPKVLNPMAFTAYDPNQSIGNLIVSAANATINEATHYLSMYENNGKTTLKMK